MSERVVGIRIGQVELSGEIEVGDRVERARRSRRERGVSGSFRDSGVVIGMESDEDGDITRYQVDWDAGRRTWIAVESVRKIG
jgi:hypothetical protein